MAADTPEESGTAPPGDAGVLAGGGRLSLWGYFIKCLKNYAAFDGRARRREFWAFALFFVLFLAAAYIFCRIMRYAPPTQIDIIDYAVAYNALPWIFTLIFAMPGIAVMVRRLHDTGKSGGRIFLLPVGLVISLFLLGIAFFSGIYMLGVAPLLITPALIFMLVIRLCREGEPFENIYGEDPKENDYVILSRRPPADDTHTENPHIAPPPKIEHAPRKFKWKALSNKPAVAIPVLLFIALFANWLYIEITRAHTPPAPVPLAKVDPRAKYKASHYTVSTAEELERLAQIVNGRWWDDERQRLYERHSFSGQTVTLTANIDLSGYDNWTPIGFMQDWPFSGTFDGGSHIIRNLTVNTTEGYQILQGLFGGVSGGTVMNLGLENVNIAGHKDAGGMVGHLRDESSVTNCYSTGTVRGSGELHSVGGLVGTVIGSTLANCYSTATVIGAGRQTGGLAGLVNGSGRVANCYSTGAVSGIDAVGGVAGTAEYRSAITGSAALNFEVAGTGDVGRVAGNVIDNKWLAYMTGGELLVTSTLINNAAFDAMAVTTADPEVRYTNLLEGKDGVGISFAEIWADGTIGGRFRAEDGWTVENGRLPGLFGKTVEIPEYLRR